MSSLKELKALGGFVSDKPVEKEIKFKLDGDLENVAKIHVKRIAISEYERLFLTQQVEDRMARTISECITLGADGKEHITFADASRLHPALAAAMVEAFNEVNIAKKSSRPETDSSAT